MNGYNTTAVSSLEALVGEKVMSRLAWGAYSTRAEPGTIKTLTALNLVCNTLDEVVTSIIFKNIQIFVHHYLDTPLLNTRRSSL